MAKPPVLHAIADIHLSYKSNREEWAKLKARGPDDGLILAGDSSCIPMNPSGESY